MYDYKNLKHQLAEKAQRNIFNVLSHVLRKGNIERFFVMKMEEEVCYASDDEYIDMVDASFYKRYSESLMDIDCNLDRFMEQRDLFFIYKWKNTIRFCNISMIPVVLTIEVAYIALIVIHYMKTILFNPVHRLVNHILVDLDVRQVERGNEYELKVQDAEAYAMQLKKEREEWQESQRKMDAHAMRKEEEDKRRYFREREEAEREKERLKRENERLKRENEELEKRKRAYEKEELERRKEQLKREKEELERKRKQNVRHKYLELAMVYHPDKGGHPEFFKSINEAYQSGNYTFIEMCFQRYLNIS